MHRAGETAAHLADRLMLLGSPPDMVHGALSHRTHTAHDPIKVELLYYEISPNARENITVFLL